MNGKKERMKERKKKKKKKKWNKDGQGREKGEEGVQLSQREQTTDDNAIGSPLWCRGKEGYDQPTWVSTIATQ